MWTTMLLSENGWLGKDWPDYVSIAHDSDSNDWQFYSPSETSETCKMTIEEKLNKYGWFKASFKDHNETWKNGLKNVNINLYGIVAWFGDCEVNSVFATPQRLTPKDLELFFERYQELRRGKIC